MEVYYTVYLNKYHFPVYCPDTRETCSNYQEYLNSRHWANFRHKYYNSTLFSSKVAFGGVNRKCVCCQRPDKPLDLHHLTYKRLGQEN